MCSARRFEKKVVIVTGSSRGIGKAVALEFAKQGARLVVTYIRNEALAEEVARQIRSEGGDAIRLQLDVCERQSVQDVFAAALERYEHVDVLVNNAGFLEQIPFMDIGDKDWDKALAVNLKGAFICTQAAARCFESRRAGCIINISSIGGQTGGPKAPHYAAAKAGVISLTKSSARLLAPLGVRVNAVAPGFIRTDMYDDIISRTSESQITDGILLGRVGEPEEVANAVLFLASDQADYITGHVLDVNGGAHLSAGS